MKPIATLAFIMLYMCISYGQEKDSSRYVSLTTRSKKPFEGKLISITKDSLTIETEKKGILSFSRDDIKFFQEGLFRNDFDATTNSSVPFFVQTALPNGEGNHYYKNYYLFGNEFNFGITDNLNFTAGFETASIFFDNGNQLPIIELGTKFSASVTDYIHGGLAFNYFFNDDGGALFLYSPITFGGLRTNVTISPGYNYSDGNEYVGFLANLSLSLSNRSRFVVDFLRFDETSVATVLYEYLFKGGFTLSIGGIIVEDGSAPNVAFSIPFGRWKNTYKKAKKNKF